METPELLESSLEDRQGIKQDDKMVKLLPSLERTKENLNMYHSVKSSLPEMVGLCFFKLGR